MKVNVKLFLFFLSEHYAIQPYWVILSIALESNELYPAVLSLVV